MSDETTAPRSDDEIVPATDEPNPGTADGVGERVEEGLGSEGVQRMDGEFGALRFEEPGGSADATGDATGV
ncbi:MAG: hypothetical protein AB7O74_16695 [Candidatus Nanopelagicales bacterium]